MTLFRRLFVVAAVLGLLLPLPAVAANSPQAVIKEFYAQLVATMKQGEQLGFSGRFEKLAPVVRASYNMPLMTKMATGSGWATASAKEQADLIAAFSTFSIATYASRFVTFDGEQFSVMGQKNAGKDIVVETRLKPETGEAVTLNYLMRADEKGNYRIIDVFMNGTISELAVRRSEFSSIVRREGIPALIKSLEEKAKQMGTNLG